MVAMAKRLLNYGLISAEDTANISVIKCAGHVGGTCTAAADYVDPK